MQNRLGDSTKTTPNTTDYNPEADVILDGLRHYRCNYQLNSKFSYLILSCIANGSKVFKDIQVVVKHYSA